MKKLLSVAVLLAVLTGCRQVEYVTIEKVRTDTTYITKWQRDSIWLHDSIRVKENGDSIIIERWHTKYVEKLLHDTLYQSKTDSVPVPYPVTQYVEKQLTWWQRTQMYAGDLVLIALLILLGYVGYRMWKVFHFF